MGITEKQKETDDGFTDRAIMSLAMEAAELKETATRIATVVAALALVYGISIEV